MTSNAPKQNSMQRKWAAIAFTLLFLYVLARPTLEQQFNISLPGFGNENAVVEPNGDELAPSSPTSPPGLEEFTSAGEAQNRGNESGPGTGTLELPATATSSPAGRAESSGLEQPTSPESAAPALGKLKQVGNKLYESTAGLRYGTGSAEGHRLLHLMKHAQDDLDKPIHGVFEGTKDEILALLDEAWLLVKQKSPQVTSEDEGDRTVYTIDLKRKIGYTGGEVGQRRKHPACSKLRIVVEGVDVITAFPTER